MPVICSFSYIVIFFVVIIPDIHIVAHFIYLFISSILQFHIMFLYNNLNLTQFRDKHFVTIFDSNKIWQTSWFW
jgi:hypothetical protein